MYAIIETGGKQYRVSEGDVLRVEKLDAAPGEVVEIEKVLALGEGEELKIGTPYVEGAKVQMKVDAQAKSKKLIIFKYKPKKTYRKKQGHRQPYSQVVVGKIEG